MQLVFPSARSLFASAGIDWSTDAFGVGVVDSTYTYSPSHDFRNDVTGVLATAALAGMTVLADGVCDADDVSVSGVTLGDIVEGIFIYRNVGTAATDDLVWYANTNSDGTPIYRVSDGNPIAFSWSNGADRIFQI